MTPRWMLPTILPLFCTLVSCRSQTGSALPAIEFTKLPPLGDGSPEKTEAIEGRVSGAKSGQAIVLFARSGVWWVQPLAETPFTPIGKDSSWKNVTHPGSAYAAVLVNKEYRAPITLSELPKPGGNVIAVAVAETPQLTRPPVETIEFSGYQWEIRSTPSNRGGTKNLYGPKNVWTDSKGFLHLRIAKSGSEWTSAELKLTRSLGYGTYRFAIQDVAHLEPGTVFSIFSWDDAGPTREFDIEVSRWGELKSKNGQFVVQPYYVPANVWRFNLPAGPHTQVIRWEFGRVAFETISKGRTVAQHSFASGVPRPGNELIHLNLYVYGNKANPLQEGMEVVIESFQYLP
ncbi:MAG: hypothetical protein K2X03_11375 [Bryobacteraceae bacterium]|nr:hypothetical protein [Bryobacteraceae bacterium]